MSGSLSSVHIRVKSFQLFAKPLVKDNQAHHELILSIKAVMKFTAGLPLHPMGQRRGNISLLLPECNTPSNFVV